MISLSDVSKAYFSDQLVLNQIDLVINRGDFLYVLGGSGAGKTSLLKLIATKESPSQGRVKLFGYDLSRISPSALTTIRRSIGYIPQKYQLIPDFSVFENVAVSLNYCRQKPKNNNEIKNHIEEICSKLGLTDKSNTEVRHLSGGEIQRVAVACALIRKPEILIADEPTGAQDQRFKWALMDLFLELNKTGTTIILATHDASIVRRVRKLCAVLREGKIFMEDQAVCFY